MPFVISIAQFNFIVGDVEGNARKIISAAHEAHAQGAALLLTPELALCGYAAEDLFLRPAFLDACDRALQDIAQATAACGDLAVVVGHPWRSVAGGAERCHNAASVLRGGRVEQTYAKQELPNYAVFDEQRYFDPGTQPCVFDVQGVRVGLLICEDAWFPGPAARAAQAGAQLLATLNASPFHLGKSAEREQIMRERVAETGLPLVYAHLVGGQDEVVFEGRSFALDATGFVGVRAPGFAEALVRVVARAEDGVLRFEPDVAPIPAPEADLWSALVLGVRDYVGKNGFPGVLLGLSGGIDSALVLAIAVDALGPDKVRAVMMPSPYTADISWIDARDMAERLGVRYDEIAIAPQFEAFKAALASEFAGRAEDATEENLQARIRGTLLMALSNKFGSVVLTTGNKSEMATGYCTLYGDMAGGFAVIKDVAKTTVYGLARWRNAHDPFGTGASPIPERIITRPPSAELRPDQKDQDSLPPYDVLDAIVGRYMENDEPIESIIAAGYARADVERVTRLIQVNEYKRRQSPVGIRVTRRSFGKDWRYPITNRFRA
ncbi:NAD+ synthase [Paracidovorax citrulli]|uniref:Glutamine-dependent NAD(+) synthetase n=2 Tax=Paracidovorax citrulli TaxID=80869 RepID=A1TRU6_PARC0|nr:NAD+ synthase [Paracidovorax citrulli]ABM33684.1 NAD+ synthetase [Paracidovorax citrulli AAC00-1]ATG94283.1 NAD+ synthase [Paracidovorax citrulli]PVY63116.1 NAD+ synthase (glutamine-hydrolysing) [Paracidovorax citrulli]QCX12584.1 Glutamine-dependent NAD(+) synthetase [Paracidovorax citrulli]REG67901.1 NAD+ synthase (glutamine-hydrolysing) [Paracidovorax citrulli]